jgi:hypothetical protein
LLRVFFTFLSAFIECFWAEWHASNVIMQSTLRAKPGAKYVQQEHLPEMIAHIRSTFPGAIFVTVAELGEHPSVFVTVA